MFRAFLFLIALAFAVWTVATSVTQVQSHERAVIRRFGRILETKPEPGLHIGLPWGIDRVDLAPVGRVRTITVGFEGKDEKEEESVPGGQMLTGDHNLVNVQASINYKIRDDVPERYVLQADNVDAFVARAADSLLAEWIGGRKIDDVLRRGKADLPPFLHEHLQERLRQFDLGIDIEHASITLLHPPFQVKDAFDKLAQAQNSIDTKVNKARQDADKRRSIAKGDAFKIGGSAKAYAREERERALAEADSFQKRLAQYRELSAKNPDYLETAWLDQMTRIFRQMKDGGQLDLLDHYLTGDLSITQFPLTPKKK
jgi:modulator of FtsH protease HflK